MRIFHRWTRAPFSFSRFRYSRFSILQAGLPRFCAILQKMAYSLSHTVLPAVPSSPYKIWWMKGRQSGPAVKPCALNPYLSLQYTLGYREFALFFFLANYSIIHYLEFCAIWLPFGYSLYRYLCDGAKNRSSAPLRETSTAHVTLSL